ncbi:MAG TPA: amino acid--[acyl-carrier-protein] ligase [Holophagaceae bacterium]|nr:amino acid--[acyl-carrier-protein] ligase [Holophagaceae bacterium]
MCAPGGTGAYAAYLDQLTRAGLLIPSGVRGVYGRSGAFEHVVEQFERFVTRMGRHLDPEVMRFPPVFNRDHYSRINHINNFPDLMGSVHSFTGGDPEHVELVRKFEHDEDWSRDLAASEVMMIPAACYPLYPTATGTLPPGGRTVDLESFVFRHEPSDDPARMQIFRQREYVRLGTGEEALAHRDYWLERGKEMLLSVGLDARAVVANDPFFGRGGRMMKATQREQVLKFELVVPICSEESPTAVSSCNYHLDYFGIAFGIKTPDGKPAHSACIGFGLERITLALFKTHGLEVRAWPKPVREILELD